MRITNKKSKQKNKARAVRSRRKPVRLTRKGLEYALRKLKACEAGIADALAAGRVPRTMFANVDYYYQWWFLESLLSARTAKTLNFRSTFLRLRKEVLIGYAQVINPTTMNPLIEAWEICPPPYSFRSKLVEVTLKVMQIKGIECNPTEALRIARQTKFDVPSGAGTCKIDLVTLLFETVYRDCLADERQTSMFRDLRRVWTFLLCKDVDEHGNLVFHSLHTDASCVKALRLHGYSRLSQMTSSQCTRYDALLDSFPARIPWDRYERAVIQRFPSVLAAQKA